VCALLNPCWQGLANQVSTRCVDHSDNTPLHRAVARGDVACCEALLEAGADPVAPGRLQATPLHVAFDRQAWRRWRHITTPAVGDANADDTADPDKPAAANIANPSHTIHVSSETQGPQHERVAELVVAAIDGAAVDPRDHFGRTPLSVAAFFGHIGGIGILLADGADPRMGDEHGERPLHRAVEGGCVGAVEALLESSLCDPSAQEEQGNTALAEAARMGHVEIIRVILGSSCSGVRLINVGNHAGETPLIVAAAAGHAKVVRELLRRGAHRDLKDAGGRAAVHHAAARGRAGIVRMLLAHGSEAPPPASKTMGEHLLWDAGGDVVDACTLTPLHLAAEEGHLAVIQALLSGLGEGADTCRRCCIDDDEEPAAVRDTLEDGIGAVWSPHDTDGERHVPRECHLREACLAMRPGDNRTDDGRRLPGLTRMHALEKRDASKRTPLLAAVERGRRDAAFLLLIHGADPDAADAHNRRAESLPRCPADILAVLPAIRELWRSAYAYIKKGDVMIGCIVDHEREGLDAARPGREGWELPWSRDLHWMWPPTFKEAVRTLLLCSRHGRQTEDLTANGGGSGGRGAGCGGGREGAGGEETDGRDGDGDGGAGITGAWLTLLAGECTLLIVSHLARPVGAWVRREDEILKQRRPVLSRDL